MIISVTKGTIKSYPRFQLAQHLNLRFIFFILINNFLILIIVKKWEYKTVVAWTLSKYLDLSLSQEHSESTPPFINDLGSDGWELVSVTISEKNSKTLYHFKRPIQ